jgi:GT2 family glycosyltransferase
VVVIGRNEGERLKRCLKSVCEGVAVVYVDSGSTDGSPQWARDLDVKVIDLDMTAPFTAARARNTGFRRLREGVAAHLPYVQFVDGDCELIEGWPENASTFLDSHADVAVVWGHLRERYPERSIYNWMCDREWDRPLGEVRGSGGIVMMRAKAFEAVGGYRDDVIASEDDELCVRLRAAGWRIWRLNSEMALHDAAMTRFSQWWRRAVRAGYGFAQGADLHGAPPERHWLWESRRAWLWGLWLPLTCLIIGLLLPPWGWAVCLVYPMQVLRQILRNRGPLRDRVLLALFQVLARFPEALGQFKFLRDRWLGRQAHIIEHK